MFKALLVAGLATGWLCVLAPGDAANAQTAAQKCYQDKDDSATVTDCTQVIKQNPKDAAAYVNRCDGYLGLGNYTAAMADCTQAIALDPKSALAFNNRCNANVRLGNYTAAVADCTQAIALIRKMCLLSKTAVLLIMALKTTAQQLPIARRPSR